MSDTLPLETLITSLVGDLKPTHRLPAPWIRTVFWLAAVLLLAALLAWNADLHSLAERLRAAPDMWLCQAGAMLTAGCAAWAAFQTSIPGRSWRWALLPLPPLALWLAASTAGCLRLWPIPGTEAEPPMHALECLHFIVLISLPLAGLLTWRLTRAFPVRPGLTAMLAGLASAGAAASLLEIIHPFDATASDLLLHLVAVLVVTALSRVAGGAWLKRKEKSLLF